MDKRFDIFLDPGNLWTVWDNKFGAPAAFGERSLIDLPKPEAEAACVMLNEIEGRRLAEDDKSEGVA